MFTVVRTAAALCILSFCVVASLMAQQNQGMQSQQLRLGDGLIRIAEPGQVGDTVNVWGDISNPGRYYIPRGTKVPELLAYARGPSRFITGETTTEWTKVRLEIYLIRYNPDKGTDDVVKFQIRYDSPLPRALREFQLKGNDIVSIQIRRRPSFPDYIRVIGPFAASLATTLLVYDRIRNLN